MTRRERIEKIFTFLTQDLSEEDIEVCRECLKNKDCERYKDGHRMGCYKAEYEFEK